MDDRDQRWRAKGGRTGEAEHKGMDGVEGRRAAHQLMKLSSSGRSGFKFLVVGSIP